MGRKKRKSMIEKPSERQKIGVTREELVKKLPKVGDRMRKLPCWEKDEIESKEQKQKNPLWCEVIHVNRKGLSYTVEFSGTHLRETFRAGE